MPRDTLTKFVKQLGLDFIITPKNEILLVELQAGFGRLGPNILFPKMWRRYRSLFRQEAFATEPNERFLFHVKRICRDKVKTYRHFKDFQPRSFYFQSWESPRLKQWLSACTSDFILAKPPLGTCGTGIRLFPRDELINPTQEIDLGSARLLQEYVFSKRFRLEGDSKSHRIGCIRHIVLMRCDGEMLHLLHLPCYWRVAPRSCDIELNENSLTANMSRGAIALRADDADTALVRAQTCRIACRLAALSFQLDRIPLGGQSFMDPNGDISSEESNARPAACGF